MGGLGNQMFQYAAGKALAAKHGVDLRLDTGFLEANPNGAYTKRNLELSVFEMPLKFAQPTDLKSFSSQQSRFKRVLRRWLPSLFKGKYFAERSQGLHKEFFSLPAHTYLDGFWQNETYFLNVREQLLNDFKPKEAMPTAVERYYARIQTSTAVSLHVRRGDYVSVATAGEFHGLAGLDYYNAAINYLQEKIGEFELFVFSDDIAWCKSNLSQKGKITYVEHSAHALWDMVLMSACNHHIIANSSFSWWGAWLDTKVGSRVIMPRFWFKNASSESLGITAKNWLTL